MDSDSQLSDLIRQGKMNESQTTNTSWGEFSQGTKQSIENGEFMLPGLSQGGKNELERLYENDETVRFTSSSVFAKVGKQSDLKRRTNRILDDEFEENNIATEPPEQNNNHINDNHQKEESILDQATRAIKDSQDVSVDLLETTFESNLTVCQTQVDSQKVEYLRKRTDEEQKQHILKKKQRRALERVKEEHYDQEYNIMYQMSLDAPMMTPYMQASDYDDDKDVFGEEEDYPQLNVETDVGESSGLQASIKLKVDESKMKKVSDYVSTEAPDGSYLWTKAECEIPLVANWTVPTCFQNSPLSLKIRFVNYDKKTAINDAIMLQYTDVKKCREHIISETGMPAESFFYITSTDGENWKFPGKEKANTGHFFRKTFKSGTTEKEFSIKFSCQEKCMQLTDKRKKMCLVVFLEDANGQTIATDFFKEVRIVAYPRRDYRNFCEKSAEHEKKYGNRLETVSPVPNRFVRQSELGSESTSVFYPYEMRNVTNTNQMLPSTSASRKRPSAAEMFSNVKPSHSSFTAPRLYQTKLLLGDYRSEHVEPMESEFVTENYQTPAKRARNSSIEFEHFVVLKKNAESVADFIANLAREESFPSGSTRRHPLDLQKNIRLDTEILIWLTTFNQNATFPCFEAHQILTIEDLVKAFEEDSKVFENIGIPSRHLQLFYQIFFNFYRPYHCDRLRAEKESHVTYDPL